MGWTRSDLVDIAFQRPEAAKMPARARRQFTDDFQAEAVHRGRKSRQMIAKVAHGLGLAGSTLRNWVERAR